jgi:integrase
MNNKVDAIKTKVDMIKLKKYFYNTNQRNYILFLVGIYTGLRAKELLTLKVKDIRDKQVTKIWQYKTQTYREIVIQEYLQREIEAYTRNKRDESWLFPGNGSHLSVNGAEKVLNRAVKVCNLDLNLGLHSLRKTFGYNLFVASGRDIYLVQEIFEHKDAATTIKYIGVLEREKVKILNKLRY